MRQEGGGFPLFDHTRAEDFAKVVRGWDGLEQRTNGIEVIGGDVSGIDPRHKGMFRTRDQALFAVSQLLVSLNPHIESLRLDRPLDQRVSLYHQIFGMHSVLSSLAHPVALETYLKDCLGMPSISYNDEQIGEAKRVLVGALARVGFMEPDLGDAFIAYKNEHQIQPGFVREQMCTIAILKLPRLIEYLGIEGVDPGFAGEGSVRKMVILEGDENSPYRVLVRRDGRQRLMVKVNPTKDYFRGDEVHFAEHEVLWHALDDEATRLNIQKGLVIPEFGLSLPVDVRTYVSEGMGVNLPAFVPDLAQDSFGQLAYNWRTYRDLVLTNCHLMVNSVRTDRTMSEAYTYAQELLKGILTPEQLQTELSLRATDQIQRLALYVYGIGELDFKNIARDLGSWEKRRQFLKQLIGYPRTYSQAHLIADQIAQEA